MDEPRKRGQARSDAGHETPADSDPLATTMHAPGVGSRGARAAADPKRLSRYELVELIGEGGFGRVYAAVDPLLGRKVAIKLLHRREFGQRVLAASVAQFSDEQRAQRALLREANALARLSHANIVSVLDAGTYEIPINVSEAATRGGGPRRLNAVFIVMEFIEGMSLDAWIASAKRSWREVLTVYLAAGRGLAAAHEKGFVHCDFKPANVRITPDGDVKVLDFGLARARAVASTTDASAPETTSRELVGAGLTSVLDSHQRTGAHGGTPAYMSPEQHLGGQTGAFTDQFSFCLALYEAIYGRSPFAGETVLDRISSLLVDRRVVDRPRPSDEAPDFVFPLLERGLSFDPQRRAPSMNALLDALEEGLSELGRPQITAESLPARLFTPSGTSPAEVRAIQDCIRSLAPGVILYWEAPAPSVYGIELMRARLDELTADGEPYALVIDLTRTSLLPGIDIVDAIRTMFRDAHLVYSAVISVDPMMRTLVQLIMNPVVDGRWSFGADRAEALALASERLEARRVASD